VHSFVSAKTIGNHPKQPEINSLMNTHLSEQDLAILEEEWRADTESSNVAKQPVSPFFQDMGMLKRDNRTCIPARTFRMEILHDYHYARGQGHMGVRKTNEALGTK